MIANFCLRRLRFILDMDDSGMIGTFNEGGETVTREQVSAWLKKEEDEGYKICSDQQFAGFLNGLINVMRGKREGVEIKAEERLTNNIILRKLKIAFDLQSEEMLEILALADLHISKHELSALFRRIDHKHYRECKDQFLRNFLMGLQIKFREPTEPDSVWDSSGAGE